VVGQLALTEWATVVRADIVQAIPLAVDMKDDNQMLIHFKQLLPRIGDFRYRADRHKFRHKR
jgi:hypothetical protein